MPASPLKYDTSYTATVTATAADGTVDTKTTSFTTMGRPGNEIGSGMYLFDGKTYGVAMPVVVEFIPGIPKKDRAAVQRRMFVETDPPQPGVWHWVEQRHPGLLPRARILAGRARPSPCGSRSRASR